MNCCKRLTITFAEHHQQPISCFAQEDFHQEANYQLIRKHPIFWDKSVIKQKQKPKTQLKTTAMKRHINALFLRGQPTPATVVLLAVLSAVLTSQAAASANSWRRREARPQLNEEDLQVKVHLMQDVLAGLEKVVDWFAQDYSSINVDGVFGIRLAQGSMEQITIECRRKEMDCPPDLVAKLENLKDKIATTGNMALPYLEAQDKAYFDKFQHIIDSSFLVDYRPETLELVPFVETSNQHYSETDGDACMSLILGTGTLDGRKMPQCTITDGCWEMMNTPGTNGYFITHELIYKMFIEKLGCQEEARMLSSDPSPNFLRNDERDKCEQIWAEALSLEKDGQVDKLKQDLFLEQTLLCGMLGFDNFFTESWMRMCLSWQSPMGCFTLDQQSMDRAMELEEERLQRERLLELVRQEARAIDDSLPMVGRKLLRETKMKGDCLAHKTGLASGVLGSYLRFLVENLYSYTS